MSPSNMWENFPVLPISRPPPSEKGVSTQGVGWKEETKEFFIKTFCLLGFSLSHRSRFVLTSFGLFDCPYLPYHRPPYRYINGRTPEAARRQPESAFAARFLLRLGIGVYFARSSPERDERWPADAFCAGEPLHFRCAQKSPPKRALMVGYANP